MFDISNDFEGSYRDNLENMCSIISFEESESVLSISEGSQVREIMVFLQSCTVSLPVLQRLCSESSITCMEACDVISVKREEDSDIDCGLLP